MRCTVELFCVRGVFCGVCCDRIARSVFKRVESSKGRSDLGKYIVGLGRIAAGNYFALYCTRRRSRPLRVGACRVLAAGG